MAIACALCDSIGRGERWRAPRFCMRTRVDPPGTCWLHSSQEELRWCAQSMVTSMQGAEKRSLYLQLLRRVGEAFQQDDLAVDNLLATISPEARSMLLKYGSAELRAALSKRIAALPNAEVRPATTSARIPDGLPQPLLDGLLAFEKRLQARYETLVERGHTRSHKYVAAAMKVPVRLAVFLAGEGIERWDIVRNRDLVAFFQKNPAAPRQPIERFLQSMEDHRPFRERRGRPAGGRKRMRDAKRRPPPQVLRPEILLQFLADVRERYSVHEYLLAWMVCRLGMIARHAYSITLDRIQLNDRGRMVIRPALVWVEVPQRVADQFRKIIEPVDPSWGKVDPESLRFVTLFDHYITDLDEFTAKVLQGRTRLLRASAIFAAMLDGHLDRVTLRHTMGVSMPTILQLERLLSVDLHRRLDPSLVEARNAHITGHVDD